MKTSMISLADFVAGVRGELEVAARRQQARSEGSLESAIPPMKVSRVILETEVVTSQETSGGGKLHYWIASVDGKRESANSRTQKVILELEVRVDLGD